MDLHNPVLLERTLEALDDKSIPLETFHDLLA